MIFQAIMVALCLTGSLATEFEMDMNSFLQSGLVMSERTLADVPMPESITMAPEPLTSYGCTCNVIENAGNCAYRYKCRCGCSEKKCLAGELPFSNCNSKSIVKCPIGTMCLPVYSNKQIVGTGCCSYASALGAVIVTEAPVGNTTGKGKRAKLPLDTGCETDTEVAIGVCFEDGTCGEGLRCSEKNHCCLPQALKCADKSDPPGVCIQPDDLCGPGYKCEVNGDSKLCCAA